MTTLFVGLCLLLVLAVVAIAVWLWLFLDIVDQAMELIRIRVEERVALIRIETISRISQMEQRLAHHRYRSRSKNDE